MKGAAMKVIPMRAARLLSAIVVLTACDKSATEAAPSATSASTPTASAPAGAGSVPASVLAQASASAAPSASTGSAASASAGRAKEPAPTASAAPAARAASKHVEGKNYALDLSSAGCKAASECTMTIRLTAVGAYHVNKEYPYKFTATAAPGVEFLSKAAPNTFTRDAGDFIEQGEKNGTMTVRFKSPAGEAPLAGTYKFSVCSADQCQIEQEKIALSVPVL